MSEPLIVHMELLSIIITVFIGNDNSLDKKSGDKRKSQRIKQHSLTFLLPAGNSRKNTA